MQNKRHLFYLTLSGAAMGASWVFLYEAYQQIGVGIATLAIYCGPIIVMVLSPFLFKEKLTVPKIIGFAAVLSGIFFINIQAIQDGKTTWGLICGIMSAIMYAIMVIFNKKAVSITGMKNATIQLTTAFLTVAIFLVLRQGLVIDVSPIDWLPILILGLLNTGIGCYLYFSAISGLTVQTVAILGYLEPLSAVVFSTVFLKEILHPIQILGGILIIGGAVFAEWASSKNSRAGRIRKS